MAVYAISRYRKYHSILIAPIYMPTLLINYQNNINSYNSEGNMITEETENTQARTQKSQKLQD